MNLHLHTTDSDGGKTAEEAAAIYKAAGYDIIAITDHWKYTASGELGGLRILSGAEYNIGGQNGADGVFHFLALGCEREPAIGRAFQAQAIIDEIKRCKGLPVLAHPAWSLNRVEQLEGLDGIEATEIYNSVSDAGESSRPYSGEFVDCAACRGLLYPLIADDDTHMYDGSDETLYTSCSPVGRRLPTERYWMPSEERRSMLPRGLKSIFSGRGTRLPSNVRRFPGYPSSPTQSGQGDIASADRG